MHYFRLLSLNFCGPAFSGPPFSTYDVPPNLVLHFPISHSGIQRLVVLHFRFCIFQLILLFLVLLFPVPHLPSIPDAHCNCSVWMKTHNLIWMHYIVLILDFWSSIFRQSMTRTAIVVSRAARHTHVLSPSFRLSF